MCCAVIMIYLLFYVNTSVGGIYLEQGGMNKGYNRKFLESNPKLVVDFLGIYILKNRPSITNPANQRQNVKQEKQFEN